MTFTSIYIFLFLFGLAEICGDTGATWILRVTILHLLIYFFSVYTLALGFPSQY